MNTVRSLPAGPLRLGVGLVLYRPDLPLTRQTLLSLRISVAQAQTGGGLSEVRLCVVDHSPEPLPPAVLKDWQHLITPELSLDYRHHPENPGFGSGMNRCFRHLAGMDLLLACNPDVIFAPDSLTRGIEGLQEHPVGLVAPALITAEGLRPACFRHPDILTLLIRGFAPPGLRRHFVRRLAHYAYLDHPPEEPLPNPDIVSGCCMLMDARAYTASGGFDERYFMYFEDFDLSIRLREQAGSLYWPDMQVSHAGGGASHKGWRHIAWFARSAWRFFRRHHARQTHPA